MESTLVGVLTFHSLAVEADHDEIRQARYISLELQPVWMKGLLGRTPSIFHRNGKECGAFETALNKKQDEVGGRIVKKKYRKALRWAAYQTETEWFKEAMQ